MLEIKLSGIKLMEELARGNPDMISLSQGGLKVNESPMAIKESLKEILSTNKADYYGSGSGLLELREKIAEKLSNEFNTSVSTEQIISTHGCNGALSIITLLLLKKGDEIILPEPAYPSYTNLAQIAGAKPVYISSLEEKNGKVEWKLPVEKIKQATTDKTKMIIFSNPSNPTSTLASKEDLLQLIDWCENKGIYLVVDEVYEDYVFDGKLHSVVPFVKDAKYLIKVSSFSKNFGLSGWRVGYMVMPPSLYKTMHTMQDSIFISPSLIGQYAALAALNNPEISHRYHEYVKTNRDISVKYLEELKAKGVIDYETPSAGFYVFMKTKEADASDLCVDIAKQAKVTLVPGSSFGPSTKGYLRLCFARDKNTLEEGLGRLISYWK